MYICDAILTLRLELLVPEELEDLYIKQIIENFN
jgi:hypothetical protein